MQKLWRTRPVLLIAFLLASSLTLFFAGRLVYSAIHWANPAHRNEVVKPWMTVRYIARSRDLTSPAIDVAANLPGPAVKGHPLTLTDIAQDRGVPVAQVIAEVEAAIAAPKAAEPLE